MFYMQLKGQGKAAKIVQCVAKRLNLHLTTVAVKTKWLIKNEFEANLSKLLTNLQDPCPNNQSKTYIFHTLKPINCL